MSHLPTWGPDAIRVGAWVQANNLTTIPAFTVNGFGLYSSVRGSSGAKYRLERSYRL